MLTQIINLGGIPVTIRLDRVADGYNFRNLKVILHPLDFLSGAAARVDPVHHRQQVVPPGLIVSMGYRQIANCKFAFIHLELRARELLRDVVLVDLYDIDLNTVDRNARFVGLNGMPLSIGSAVAAAADQGRGIGEGILALGARKAAVGQNQRCFIRDLVDRQQARVIVVGDFQAICCVSRNKLSIRPHGTINNFDAVGIKVHVGGNGIGQLQQIAIVKLITVGVDLDGVGDRFAWVTVLIHHQNTVAVMLGAVRFGQVALAGHGHFVGGFILISVARGDFHVVLEGLAAAGRTGNTVPFLVGNFGIVCNPKQRPIQALMIIRVVPKTMFCYIHCLNGVVRVYLYRNLTL